MNKQDAIINAIRFLSVDAIQKANSGHPGLPVGSASIGYTVWNNMKMSPSNAKFVDRDRFILSAGHGSMLNYSLLNLFGFGLDMEELKNFRQLGSRTPGHPEYKHTIGVECSTGPLGQGVANGVGFALAEKFLANKFNRDGFNVVDHYTYVMTGDGCMQEGIEYEAASLAGTLKLGKLIVFYDKNDITIEGNINTAFSENVGARHEAQGWHVITVEDGNDVEGMEKAIAQAKAETEKPSLIICLTEIGYGSPLQGKASCHGAPLGLDNIAQMRKNLGWEYAPFELPKECENFKQAKIDEGKEIEKAYNEMYAKYKEQYSELAHEFETWMKGEHKDLEEIEELWSWNAPDATRNTSNKVLNILNEKIANLFGGSADLEPANKSKLNKQSFYGNDSQEGMNVHFGIREHAMSAICNGIQLHGGLQAYCATFLAFTDYMKNAMRMSAIMDLPVTYILTHDSIGVGEDGPTHQPIEHLAGLRAMPNMKVYRPADGCETACAYISAMTEDKPTSIVLTRQNLPQYENSGKKGLKGGYILADSEGTPDVILMGSGSEVEQIFGAKEILEAEGIKTRVVSMPCLEVFDAQSDEYKESVLPKAIRARVAVEASSAMSWYKYVGFDGAIISMDKFGESAPAGQLFKKYGFTVENVVETAKRIVK